MPAIRVDFIAQFAQFQDSLNQIKRSVDKNIGGLDKGFSALRGTLAGLGVSLSAGTFVAFVKSAIDAQDQMGKMAQKVGLSTESLSALEHSARLSDVSLETLGQSMKKLSVNMLELQGGGGEATAAFRALKIEVLDGNKNLRSSEDVLFDIADKFSRMEDGAGKTALAVKIFGRAGSEMIPMLNQGADGLKKNAEEAKRFGIIISTEAAKKAEEFNDNLTRLATASRAAGISLSGPLLDPLNKIIERFLIASKVAGGLAGVMGQFGFFGITVETAADKVVELEKEISKLSDTWEKRGPLARTLSGGQTSFDFTMKRLQQRLEFAQELAKLAPNQTPPLDRPEPQKDKAPGLPDEKKIREAESALQKFQDKLRDLDAQASKALGVDRVVDDIKRFIEGAAKDFEKLGPKQAAALKGQLVAAAERVDQEKDFISLLKQESEAQEQLAKDTAEAWGFVQPMLDKLKNRERLENIFGEEALGLSTEDLQTKLDQLVQSIDFMADEWDNAARAAGGFDEHGKKIADDSDKLKDLARDIGLTFSSAFEDAVVGGKKLRDVLSGLVQDLARLATRKLVTEPILKAFEGVLGPALRGGFGGLFGGGGGSANMTVSDTGGRRSAGELLMVGRVPGGEIWKPDGSGTMIPSSKLADASGPQINVDMRNSLVSVDAVRLLNQKIDQLQSAVPNMAVSAVASAAFRGGAVQSVLRGA